MRKLLGFLAIAGLLFVVAPSKPAHAISLLNPAAASLVHSGDAAATEVRWRRGGFGYRRGFYRPRYFAPRRYYRPYYAPRRFYGGRRFYRRF